MENTKQEKKKDLKEFWRAFKFTIISISAGLVQTGTYAVCHEIIKLNHWVASAIGLILSVIWNFTINRKYTFKSANNIKIAMLLVLAFYAVFTPVSTILGNMAQTSGVNEYIVLAVTMILNFVLEFLFTRFVVYRNSCDTAVVKQKEEKVEEKPEEK
jgi:putative flippase GtrA